MVCYSCLSYFQELAKFAEEHLSDVNAPLFLRFINLLINDATFLLDEALAVRIFKLVAELIWM